MMGKDYAWTAGVDYRRQPNLYRVGRGEQGVLICEPYKSELLPHWRFRTPDLAAQSSATLSRMFSRYLALGDFPGADMARKFLQMGFTRARRYANYKGGRKYRNNGHSFKKGTGDPEKAKSAAIFYRAWRRTEGNLAYVRLKRAWRQCYG